jgi:hypothetical protein
MSYDNHSYPVSECGRFNCLEGHFDALLVCKVQYIWCSPGKKCFLWSGKYSIGGKMVVKGMYRSIWKGILCQDSQNFGLVCDTFDCNSKELPLQQSSVEDVKKFALVSTALWHKKLGRNDYYMSIILLAG